MPNKFPGKPNATGYWGRCGVNWRINVDQTPEKIYVMLADKLLGRGKPVRLWLPVSDSTPGVVACSCSKDTSTTNDRVCNECYGFGFVPGFELFLAETVHFGTSEAEAAPYTLTGTFVDKSIKPYRILLSTGEVSGTIETTDKAYTNTTDDDWEVNTDVFLRDGADNTATVEFSTDSGGTWFDVSLINGVDKPTGTGTLRFRVTLTRTAAGNRSPAFEIVRARHVRSGDYNDYITMQRSDVTAGQVLVLRPWAVEQAQSDTGRGRTIDWLGDRSWTMPLNWFDESITAETPAARVNDRNPGPHPFYEYATGIKTGDRVVMTSVKWNEEFGIFTHQSFDERLAQEFEPPYELVF